MRRHLPRLLIVWAVVLAPASAFGAAAAATWSFAAGDHATCPKTVAYKQGKLTVDLSALPKGATVFRAVLRMRRERGPGRQREGDKAVIVPADAPDKPLPLTPPRYRGFDATAPVAAAVKSGKGKVELLVKSLSWWKRETTRLDVSFTGPSAQSGQPGRAAGRVRAATDLVARHRNGQTVLTWRQPGPTLDPKAKVTFGNWQSLWAALPTQPGPVTYRIYRHTAPISSDSIAAAELVDEVEGLTCWNREFHGRGGRKTTGIFRYVAEDGKEQVPPGTGIYAHNPPRAGKAWYAVSAAVAGEEHLTALKALAGAIEEKVGPGEPILQRVVKPEKFFYTKGITLHYYTRWEAPPRCNMPSRPYDYVVIVPEKVLKPAPLNLVLHCWGSNLYGAGGAYTWHGWKDKTRGIGVASNQIPYDWWTCYHENAGTWKPWTEGLARNFTPDRLLAFVDWVCTKWDVDRTRMVVSGESMGGSGSTFMPIRYGDRFAYAYSAVGIHNPAAIKGGGFYESYAGNVGVIEAKLKHESGMGVWDYLNDPLLVRKDPKSDLPFIGFGNGKNDHGIGWPHAVDLAKAFQEARQPHGVIWRVRGHGSGTWYPGIDFRTDQSLPAFTKCSLDDDIGTATKVKEPKKVKMPWGQIMTDIYDGDSEGQINTFLRWQTDDVVDEPDRWEMTVYLTSGNRGAPKDECTVNITPRRCRKFKPKPGQKLKWTNVSLKDSKQAGSGTVTADKWGLVTLKGATVAKGRNRIRIAAE